MISLKFLKWDKLINADDRHTTDGDHYMGLISKKNLPPSLMAGSVEVVFDGELELVFLDDR